MMAGRRRLHRAWSWVAPTQRTDFHVDPYEEWFYQLKGNMHVNLMTDGGPRTVHIREGETWLLPRQHAALAAAAGGRLDRPGHRAGPRGGHAGEVPVVLPELQPRSCTRSSCRSATSSPTCRRCSRRSTTTSKPAPARTAAPCTREGLRPAPRGPADRRPHPLRAEGLAGPAGVRRSRLAVAADRLRARRDDHGRRDGVPPDRRRLLGRRRSGWPTWTPTAWPCRWSRRRRCSSATTARPTRRSRSPGSSTI